MRICFYVLSECLLLKRIIVDNFEMFQSLNGMTNQDFIFIHYAIEKKNRVRHTEHRSQGNIKNCNALRGWGRD